MAKFSYKLIYSADDGTILWARCAAHSATPMCRRDLEVLEGVVELIERSTPSKIEQPANVVSVAGGQGTANSAMPKLLKELRCLIEEATFDQSEYAYRCFEILEQLSA